MQGVFIHGSRPPTKKFLKAAVDTINEGGDPFSVVIEATSMFGNEFDGSLHKALEEEQHGPFYLVGPDPRTSRKWYANLEYVPNPVPRPGNPSKGKWNLT